MGSHRPPAPVSPLLAPGWTELLDTCGTQAAAQSSQAKATTTSLSAANPLSQTQAAVTADQAGADTANQNGARFIPNPQIPEQGTFPRGMHGFSITENTQCFGGGRALVLG